MRIAAVWTLLVLTACLSSADAPIGAAIECESNNDCPADFDCNPSSRRCVSAARGDLEPPEFAQPTVAPVVGTTETEFEITFVVDEALVRPPQVSLGEPAVALRTLSGPDGSGRFRFGFQASRDAALPDGVYPVSVVLIDEAGNATSERLGVSVRLDQNAPSLISQSPPELIAGSTNVLRQVSALTVGSRARVVIAADEPVDACLQLVSEDAVFATDCPDQSSESAIAVQRTTEFGVAASFDIVMPPDGSPPEGVFLVRLVLIDQAGNRTEVQLDDTLTVDTTAPNPPNVETADAFVLIRAPYGVFDRPAQSVLELLVEPSAIADGEQLVVYAQPDGTAEITRVSAEALPASGRIDLPSVDRQRAFLARVDNAGNRSDIVSVRDVEYVLTPSGRTLGAVTGNQSELRESAFTTAALEQADSITLSDDGELSAPDGNAREVEGTPAVYRVSGGDFPDPGRTRLLYDPRRAALAAVGVVDFNLVTVDSPNVWLGRGAFWEEIEVSDDVGDSLPPAGFLSAFDANQSTIVTNPTNTGEYWRLVDERWVPVDAQGAPGTGGVAFDETQRVLYALGIEEGEITIHRLSADGRMWMDACSAAECSGSRPSALLLSDVFFSQALGGVVAVLPEQQGMELAVFDGTQWLNPCMSDACRSTRPPQRFVSSAAATPEGLLFYGGRDPSNTDCPNGSLLRGTLFLDTWSFTPGPNPAWTCESRPVCLGEEEPGCDDPVPVCNTGCWPQEALTAEGLPVNSEDTAMGWNPQRGRMVLLGTSSFGGGRRPGLQRGSSNEILEWQGDHWRCVANCAREAEPFDQVASEPGRHIGSSASFDPQSGRSYVLTRSTLNATWAFSDRSWQLLGEDPHPESRTTQPFGLDGEGRLITVGGSDGTMRVVDGAFQFDPSAEAGSRWSSLCTGCAPTRPAISTFLGTLGAEAGVDRALYTVNNSGSEPGDLFAFDPTTTAAPLNSQCTSGCDASFPDNVEFGAAIPIGERGLLLVVTPDTFNQFADTYFFDGQWSNLGSPDAFKSGVAGVPWPRNSSALLFGGNDIIPGFSGIFVNTDSLRMVTPTSPPTFTPVEYAKPIGDFDHARSSHTVVQTEESGVFVLTGGRDDSDVLDLGESSKPRHVLVAPFFQADANFAELTQLEARWFGSAQDGSGGLASATIKLWDGYRFVALAEGQAPEVRTVQDVTGRPRSELVSGPEQTLYLAIEPAGVNAFPDMARLLTDYVEVRLRYRLSN
ncbi:MAG: hypothetical protein AAF605_03810 [Myxococcota bacterium]